ncbi:GNAT family N-acetyltransferase, partial [Lysobacter sp. 2RAB21]
MSIVVRDVREHELDSVLALNNAAGPAILPLDAARLRHFFDTAEYFRVAERDGTLAGFLIGMGAGSDHDSSNFRWFLERYPDFFYIDRIVVASRRRGGGVGRAFYADAQSYAELRYPQLACEVFL